MMLPGPLHDESRRCGCGGKSSTLRHWCSESRHLRAGDSRRRVDSPGSGKVDSLSGGHVSSNHLVSRQSQLARSEVPGWSRAVEAPQQANDRPEHRQVTRGVAGQRPVPVFIEYFARGWLAQGRGWLRDEGRIGPSAAATFPFGNQSVVALPAGQGPVFAKPVVPALLGDGVLKCHEGLRSTLASTIGWRLCIPGTISRHGGLRKRLSAVKKPRQPTFGPHCRHSAGHHNYWWRRALQELEPMRFELTTSCMPCKRSPN